MIDAVLFDCNAIQLRVGDRGSELTIVDSQVQAEGEIVSFAGIIQALTLSRDEHISRLKRYIQFLDERISNGGCNCLLQFLLADRCLDCERAILIALISLHI